VDFEHPKYRKSKMNKFGYTSYTLEEAMRRMERYCVYQERCHQEIHAKLIQMRMIPEAIDTIIVHLIEHDFLNESRFAETFALGKFRQKQWGRLRIRRELKSRGIGDFLIQKALKTISEAEYLTAFEELAAKKREQWKALPKDSLNRKMYQFLAYRGWENELIFDYLHN
jgi:regulatory protein